MTEIRAFVAHSFLEQDEALVRAFLKYFDQLSSSSLNFFWEHAEPAEPRVLAEKVVSLLSDKNVFIAICTRKERVIAPTALKTALYPRGFLKAREDQFSWKTSDWIIQEIGLAIGRGLSLILLVESGVQKPGGLQGDMEYIQFDRTSPEKSFGKLVEMVSALSPRVPGSTAASSDVRERQDGTEREQDHSTTEDWLVPKPEWTRLQYENALMFAIDIDNTVGAATITEAYLQTDDAARGDNRARWEAFSTYIRLSFRKGGSLAKLKSLAEAHPKSSGTLEHLAKGFALFDHHLEAGKTYEAAAQKASEDLDILRLLGFAAVEYADGGGNSEALAIIGQMKSKAEMVPGAELRLLRVLRQVAETTKDEETTLAFMERIIEVDPDDSKTRFSLAYKYSESGRNDLALFHYLKIAAPERASATWNNLGAAFEQLELSAKAVDAFEKAEEMGETLAMSNLARKFISGGFLREAQEKCSKALEKDDVHENVARTLARLKGLPDEEGKKQTELVERTRPKSHFYKEFGRAAARTEPQVLAERWEGPECVLTVTLRGAEFTAVGSYERRGLAGFFTETLGAGVQSSPDRFRIEYRGTLLGMAINGSVSRTKEGEPPKVSSLLSSNEDKLNVMIVLADDGSEFRVMENPTGSAPRFYSLKIKNENQPAS